MSGSEKRNDVVLEARNIVKSYGGIHALKGVDFQVRAGTVTTLLGENGAGKSTLVKILSGVEQPTSGEIFLDGEPVSFASTIEAAEHDIAIIHQELSLAPNMSVRDNIFMGREIPGTFGVDYAEERRQARELLEEMQLDIDPDKLVSDLRVGQQQLVEIARALSIKSRILIMDEPTSALAASEIVVLFGIIRELLARGVAIVYISHHLEEALELTDHTVVLRDGNITAKGEREEIDLEWIVRSMVGENFELGHRPTRYEFGSSALNVDGVVILDEENPHRRLVDEVSLDVKAGEVVCIYGLMGAGRTELLEAIAGRHRLHSGDIMLDRKSIVHMSIAERIEAGVCLVPEDRQRDGLVQSFTVGENLTLASLNDIIRHGMISRVTEKARSMELMKAVTVKAPGPDLMVGALSGGNQQKVVIGKAVATMPRVLLLDEPTRGIDVGAKAEVFRLLNERAEQGLAVLFSTSEVAECLIIPHRVLVMRRGRLVAEFTGGVTEEQILSASGGSPSA